jgi:hypothetical protein
MRMWSRSPQSEGPMNGLRTWQSILRRGTVGAYQTSLIRLHPGHYRPDSFAGASMTEKP